MPGPSAKTAPSKLASAPPPSSDRPSSPTGELPRVFGRYMLFDHIGQGGMADIYLAKASTGLGSARRVVVKEIRPALSRDPEFAKMLSNEARLAAQLNHANIVQVLDLGKEEDRLFIAMEYVEGFDLHQWLVRLSKARIPLPAEYALLIVREVLRALDYAHRVRDSEGRPLDVVHRDVSPSNVLISFDGEVKLCDFGIARALARPEVKIDEETAARARVVGKIAYMAPEMIRGEEVNGRADIYAAGILLWELCSGRRMIKGTAEEMFARAREGGAPPLASATFPEQGILQAILDKALAVEPTARYLRAADFLADLETYCSKTGLFASELRFGEFLRGQFAEEILSLRRAREEAGEELFQDSFPPPSDGTTDISFVRPIPRTPVPPAMEVQRAPLWPWVVGLLVTAGSFIALVRWLL
ncbi:MAG: serine/threonine protein kinase [Myxococcales bacterium]|nr:serine/threonine protein kinase [Myxococcales bacterium]